MENEGIMGLPAGQAMQNQAPPQQPVYLSSADSYDAALQGLGTAKNDPSQAEAVKQAVRESIDELALSPTEVTALLDVLEYMSQNPGEYPELRQRLIESDMIDADDLPETYDAAYLGMAIMVLNEYQASSVEGAQAPMQMAPEVENLGPMPMAEGGLADVAQYLASRGRNGDSILAHITPAEARLLKEAGGAGTINPETGLREFFLKKLFKGVKKAVKKLLKNPIVRVIATVALAAVIGPAAIGIGMSTAAAAATASVLSSAAVSAAAGEKINAKSLLINAATSYFGAGGTIGSVNPVSTIARYASRIPGVTEKIAQGIGAGVTSAAIGKAAGMSTQDALRMGIQQGAMTGYTYEPLQDVQVTGKRVPTDDDLQEVAVTGRRAEAPISDVAPAATTSPAAQQVAIGAPGAVPTAAGLPTPPAMRYDPFTGQYTPSATAQAATAPMAGVAGMPAGGAGVPAGGAQPSTMFGRMGQFARDLMPGGNKPTFEDFKNAFLVNQDAKTTFGRYVPAGITAAGIGALTGGFESKPVNENPLFDRRYGGAEFIRDNPQMFAGNLGRIEGPPQPYDPVVPTPSYTTGQQSRIPLTPVPLPQPARVPTGAYVPPYNPYYGPYGTPDLNPPVEPPVYMASGGSVSSDTSSADYWYNELRKDNPTMDAERLRAASVYRAAQFAERNQTPFRDFADQTATGGSSTAPRETTGDYWYNVLLKSNPSIDANLARQLADERASVFAKNPEYAAIPRTNVPQPLPFNPFGATSATRPYQATPEAYRNIEARFSAPDFSQPATPTGVEQPNAPGVQYNPFQGYNIAPLAMPKFFKDGGSPTHFPRKTGPIDGPGTGTSDSIPAMLSDGEFVFTARAVRNAGNGSRRKGAKRMYALMKKLEGGPVKG